MIETKVIDGELWVTLKAAQKAIESAVRHERKACIGLIQVNRENASEAVKSILFRKIDDWEPDEE